MPKMRIYLSVNQRNDLALIVCVGGRSAGQIINIHIINRSDVLNHHLPMQI